MTNCYVPYVMIDRAARNRLPAMRMFTTADNYVVQIRRPLQNPLASMVVASALTIDTALKQDSRGFG